MNKSATIRADNEPYPASQAKAKSRDRIGVTMQGLLSVILFTCVTLVTAGCQKEPNHPPVAQARGPYSGIVGTAVTFDGSLSSDPDHDTLTLTWDFGDGANGSGSTPSHTYNTAGTFAIKLTANDGRGGVQTASTIATIAATPTPIATATPRPTAATTASAIPTATPTATVAAQNQPPTANPGGPYSGSAGQSIVFNGTASMDPDNDTITFAWNFGDEKTGTGATPSHVYATAGVFTVTVTVNDGRGGTNSDTTKAAVSAVSIPGPRPPPDPASIAPQLPGTTATSLASATEFLYTGPSPIQTGVPPNTIELKRAAVLRGKVLGRNGTPLPTVKISVLGHTEFGQTLSRADGMFDLAVNGGGPLTVCYEKDGFLPVQRQLRVPWQDFALVSDVVLIAPDANKTKIDLDPTAPVQVMRGSPVTDTSGTRQATVIFPQGTSATATLADGSKKPLTTLNVRATEYTVGPNGPAAMPAQLPPTSGYTYALDLSADEAPGQEVQFSKPVIIYVENFLNFPVGDIVPTGSYDRVKAAWIPSSDGRVVKILGITGGMADLDANGDGVLDNAGDLTALGVSDSERQKLATLYSAGQSLWRVPITHFSWDTNWPFGPPPDAGGPQVALATADDKPDKPNKVPCGSIIEIESQVLGESVGVVGTPFSVNYRSDRVSGRKAAYTLDIPLSGATLPASLQRIDLEVSVAGQKFSQSFPVEPNKHHLFSWNGNDAYGRTVQGAVVATVRVGYVYQAVYKKPGQTFQNFAATGVAVTAGAPVAGRQELTIWQETQSEIGSFDFRLMGLGGWSLSPYHVYDPASRVLYKGDGTRRDAQAVGGVIITTVAGGASFGSPSGDGGPATQATLSYPFGVAVAPDGSLFIADMHNNCVRRVGPDGIITSVAGKPTPGVGFSGDGGLATQAKFNSPCGVAVTPDGSLYIADTNNNRIRRVAPDGIITTVAGNGNTTSWTELGDGRPATQAEIWSPFGIAVAPDGSLYIADLKHNRIRRVAPDGIISTVAGSGYGDARLSGDGGPATKATLNWPYGIAVAPDGSLYIADTNNNCVRRVRPDGIITSVAGTGVGGDGGPAAQATLAAPSGVAVAADGTLYIADSNNNRVRRVSVDGIITTVAGSGGGPGATRGDGGPATQATLASPSGIAVAPDGRVYIADKNNLIRLVGFRVPGVSASEIVIAADGGDEVYVFNGTGRHLRTLNALTGAVRYQFAYDNTGRLTTVTDGDGNLTTIEQDGSGNPSAIIASGGQRTALTLDANGYLASVTNPANEPYNMTYSTDGLLKSFTDPKTNGSIFNYDPQGRLFTDENAVHGVWTLMRSNRDNGYTVNMTSPEHHTTTYEVDRLLTGDERRVTHFPDGTQTELLIGTNGSRKTTSADGTIIDLLQGPDPRFGMQVPLPKSLSITTGGKTFTLTTTRTRTPTDLTSPLTALTDTVTLNGRTFTSVYDAASKTRTSTTAEGRESKPVIDSQGRIGQLQVSGLLPADVTYDSGRLSGVKQGTGVDERATSITYDDAGYPDTLTDPLDRKLTFTAYDDAGRLKSEMLPDARNISCDYDKNGNLSSITPPGKTAHLFSYTKVDLPETYTPPDIGAATNSTVYAYNLDKQVTSITRPDGKVLKFDYEGSGGCNCGRLSTLTLPTGVYAYDYDPTTGKLKSIRDPNDATLAYTYQGALLKQTSWSGGVVTGTVERTYNNDVRVDSLSVNGANPITFQYDNDGMLKQAGALTVDRKLQSGLWTRTTTLGNLSDSWNYNNFGEAIEYTASYSGSEIFKMLFNHYDKLSRITTRTETIAGETTTFDYDYDLAGGLKEVKKSGTVTATYTYDSNGNRLTGPGLTSSPIYDDQDRLKQYGGTTYSYTDNGELKTKTIGAQVTKYEYDVLGNLIQLVLPDGSTIDYVVDGRNRRIGKKVNSALVQGFLYETDLKPIAELDASNHIVSRFVYATHVNVPDYLIRGGATYRIITDHLGSPRLVVDVGTGTIVQRMDYDEYGNVLTDTNPGFQPFGFAGGLYDRNTKLLHFGARDYDAQTARWTAKDPILFAGGDSNLYAYAGNDANNLIDPRGTSDTPIIPLTPSGLPTEGVLLNGGLILGAQVAGGQIVVGTPVSTTVGSVALITPAASLPLSNLAAAGGAGIGVIGLGVVAAGAVGIGTGILIDKGITAYFGKSLGEEIYDALHPEENAPAYDPTKDQPPKCP